MKRIVHKASNFKEADQWDIEQQAKMTIDERLAAAKELKRRVYGMDVPDVREAERKK